MGRTLGICTAEPRLTWIRFSRRKTCESSCRAAYEVRASNQSQNRKPNRPQHSAQCAGESGSSHQVRLFIGTRLVVTRVVLLCAVFYVLCSSVEAQQPGKTFRIG